MADGALAAPGRAERLRAHGLDPRILAYARELAELPPDLDEAGRRGLLHLALALLAAEGQGHTRLALSPAPGSAAAALLERLGLELPPLLERLEAAGMLGAPGMARPLLREGAWLSTHRMHVAEASLAARIRALAAAPGQDATFPEAILREPVALNAEQAAAVRLALARPLALLTGGPGTGKTSIVVAILRALLHQPGLEAADVALAAPTGKAAQRMGEAIRHGLRRLAEGDAAARDLLDSFPEPKTLHRLLAWQPAAERFRHDAANPLSARVVIVDEASMVSLVHLERLLRALAPGARLVLLGDADQLASVEAGRAFRDLVEALPDCCVRLRTSYRMREEDPDGRAILTAARAVNEGDAAALWEGPQPVRVRREAAELEGHGVELLAPEPNALLAFCRRWFEEQVLGLEGFREKAGHVFTFAQEAWKEGDLARLEELFAHLDRFRILCAQREAPGLRGAEGLNALFHGWMAACTGEGLRQALPFLAGEPVLMTANDYRRGVFNGDQGLVLKVRFEDGLRQAAVFPRSGGFQPFPLEALREQLELCYAMTVHKAQGSEYARIALVLPRTDPGLLTRELLYTALTRARSSVALLAEPERLDAALARSVQRDSGLAERLQKEPTWD